MQGLIVVLAGFEVSLQYVWLLLLFLTVDASFRLTVVEMRIYLLYTFVLLLLSSIVQGEWNIPFLLFALLLIFMELCFHHYFTEREEQRNLYEQLLHEYRQLKRMNIENEQVARLQERTRIARDIHDSVGHKLTALMMQIEMLSIQKQSNEYDDLKELARESLEETRHAVKALRHEEAVGISSVLQLIRKLESESHLLIRFTTKHGVLGTPLTNEQSIVLYRSIQEALTNAMKHGSSREVTVTLGRSAVGDLVWLVANAIHKAEPFEIGFGLTAMRERVEEQGGELRIYQTDKEFIIEGSMPVKENAK